MEEISGIDREYYRKRLAEFIAEMHPQLADPGPLVELRSRQAVEAYRTMLARGASPLTAAAQADEILYSGLLFSRFDTLRYLLAADYPNVPDYCRRSLALELDSHLEPLFRRYRLDDGLLERPEYCTLLRDLKRAVAEYFDKHETTVTYRGRPGFKP